MESIFKFKEYFNELKKRLLVTLGFGLIGLIIGLIFSPTIIQFLSGQFSLASLKPTDSFNAYLTISFYFALVFLIPVLIIQTWLCVKPALKETEIKLVRNVFVVGFFLFCFGIIAGLLVSLISLQFFSEFSSSMNLVNVWSIQELISFVLKLSLAFGVIFVLIPLIIYFLLVFTSTTKKQAIVGSFFLFPALAFVSAWLTPPDVFSQVALLVPIYGLIFSSIILVKKNTKEMKE